MLLMVTYTADLDEIQKQLVKNILEFFRGVSSSSLDGWTFICMERHDYLCAPIRVSAKEAEDKLPNILNHSRGQNTCCYKS